MPQKRKLTLDHLAINRFLALEEDGTEHFERDLTHDENALSILRRIDFGKTVEADAEKESQPVKEWPWQGLCQNLVEAQGELSILMHLIDNVQANIEVDVVMMHRPRRLPNEDLSDRAISLSIKLLTFNRLSKYIKQSVRSLSQKVSREATFYGALMRLQRNWKVRQKKDRTVGSGENSGFVVVLSNDVLKDFKLSFHSSSLCMVDLDQDASGMLTANLPKHSRRSFHAGFNQGKSGRIQWEYIRKKTSSTAPCSISVDDSQIRDQETGRTFSKGIGEGVDEGSKRAHSIFREILSEIFDLQVFEFVMKEIDGVNPTGISENFLQLNLSPEITLTLSLESSPSDQDEHIYKESVPKHIQGPVDSDFDMTDGDSGNQVEGNNREKSIVNQEDQKDNEESFPMHNQKSIESDVDMTDGDTGQQMDGGDSGHQMEGEAGDTKKEDTIRFSRQKRKHPTPLSSEVCLQQIVLRKIMGSYIREKGLMMGKARETTTGVAVGGGQEALPSNRVNILKHFSLALSHRIFSYKVLDELENMLHVQYLCLVSHPTWAPYTSAWFLYLDIPETVICRVQTKVSEWNGAQKNIRSRYYCKMVVHKESLTIEGGPIPCVGGLSLGTPTEVHSISEYRCGLADLTLFLLHQVASQILHWLHEEVKVYKEKVKRDVLGLSFEVDKSYTITLVANIDTREYNINWWLVVKDMVIDDYGESKHVITNLENTMDDGVGTSLHTSSKGLESKLLGSLKLENLYDIVLDLVSLCRNNVFKV